MNDDVIILIYMVPYNMHGCGCVDRLCVLSPFLTRTSFPLVSSSLSPSLSSSFVLLPSYLSSFLSSLLSSLLPSSLDVLAEDRQRKTPRRLAFDQGHEGIVQYLRRWEQHL